jgi:hypothetical protein
MRWPSWPRGDGEQTRTVWEIHPASDGFAPCGVRGVLLGDPAANPPTSTLGCRRHPRMPGYCRARPQSSTTAASTPPVADLRAGVPNVACPWFADQPFWAERVHGHHQRSDHSGRLWRAAGLGAAPGPDRGLGDRRHGQLRGRADPVPPPSRPGRGRGQPPRPTGAAPTRQVRPAGCRGRRPCGPGPPGQRPKGRRRPGGDDPLAAGGPGNGDQGPHPGHQRPQGAGGHRTR